MLTAIHPTHHITKQVSATLSTCPGVDYLLLNPFTMTGYSSFPAYAVRHALSPSPVPSSGALETLHL